MHNIYIGQSANKYTFGEIINFYYIYMLDKALSILAILILLFIGYNLYYDIKDYFYTKNLKIMDALLSNKIII